MRVEQHNRVRTTLIERFSFASKLLILHLFVQIYLRHLSTHRYHLLAVYLYPIFYPMCFLRYLYNHQLKLFDSLVQLMAAFLLHLYHEL